MNNSLMVLDQTVRAAIDHELGRPSNFDASTSQRRIEIAGVEVVTTAFNGMAIDDNMAALYRRLTAFGSDKAILEAKMEHAGITPLAIVPASAWDYLCIKSKLYCFAPKEGAVRISTEILRSLDRQIPPPNDGPDFGWAALWWLVVSIGLCIFTPINSIGTFFGWCFFFDFLGGMVFGIVLGVCSDDRRESARKELLGKMIRTGFADGSINDLLWPSYREPAADDDHTLIRIGFPDAPADVQGTLVKAAQAGFEIKIAAVADAITLREDLFAVLMKSQTRRLETMRQAGADPIAFVAEGSAVAIIAQYGDFPIEVALIDEVAQSVYLA
jgi:hypothetical protein